MIIQKVLKGINGINRSQVDVILQEGITCRWWNNVNPLPRNEIPLRLNERNLYWHQNRYSDPDPLEGGQPFYLHTPFISTTAGTVERDAVFATNLLTPAWEIALRFATNDWTTEGYLFHCYVFILGRRAIGVEAFAEEIRELNIYTGFSPYQPEGEITAKVVIPPAQIEKAELWSLADAQAALNNGILPVADPNGVVSNDLFVSPATYNNVRDVLA
jgi:hypothetical protein